MSLFNRITKFAKSEQGKKLISQAEKVAKDPKTKARINEARERLEHKDRQPANANPPASQKQPPPGATS